MRDTYESVVARMLVRLLDTSTICLGGEGEDGGFGVGFRPLVTFPKGQELISGLDLCWPSTMAGFDLGLGPLVAFHNGRWRATTIIEDHTQHGRIFSQVALVQNDHGSACRAFTTLFKQQKRRIRTTYTKTKTKMKGKDRGNALVNSDNPSTACASQDATRRSLGESAPERSVG